jgi:RNA polymerase sigma-70 factor (ECF subfamily)
MALEVSTFDHRVGMSQALPIDWNRVYLEHAPRVYNYFRFRLGTNVDVEDLTSRTFEKAWLARENYRRDLAGFGTWLFKIAQNVAVDHLRARRNYVPIDESLQLATETTPESDAERGSNLARLAVLTKDLRDRDRDLLALKYGAVATNREIAKLLGLSESNVGTLLHRLVQTLRSRWSGDTP